MRDKNLNFTDLARKINTDYYRVARYFRTGRDRSTPDLTQFQIISMAKELGVEITLNLNIVG